MSDQAATVILLEDEATLSELLTDGLRSAGYQVIATTTVQQMRDAVAAVDGRATLVADRALQEQGPNGFQAAAAELEQHPALRVIYMSGTHIAVRRREMGPRERGLMKPFAIKQLLGMVRELSR